MSSFDDGARCPDTREKRSELAQSNFVGSKGGAGLAQWIISHMPAHRTYVECCLGKGVILKTKLRASRNIGIEADPLVISRYWYRHAKSIEVIEGDCLTVLPALKLDSSALVYCDPPYLGSVRSDRNRVYYGREMLTEADHEKLLTVLQALPCMVMISGYQSELYSRKLAGWRTDSKWTITRGGKRVQECLWLNFDPPIFLHDARFIGSDFTDRQGAKRKIARWKKRFSRMEPAERFAILEALTADVDHSRISHR